MKSDITKPDWGLLPADIRALILKREWNNEAGLKARLNNSKPFPIRIGLKPPSARNAIDDLAHFQRYIDAWKSYPKQQYLLWESRRYRTLAEQHVPKYFVLNSVKDLIDFIGPQAIERSRTWEKNMAPLLSISENLYPVLVRHLNTIESMRSPDTELLAQLVTQLRAQMGSGYYLRALPLKGVDTKFLEKHQALVTDMLDIIHNGQVSAAGGLLAWLGCARNPGGWLGVRPLCERVRQAMGGFALMQLDTELLRQQVLPARNILVVENRQSGLGLPALEDTVAVFGGGRNTGWMDADWLASCTVAYWGDIDTWGLGILSDVRSKLPTVDALMMDEETLNRHPDRMVEEPESLHELPARLSREEARIFHGLRSGQYPGTRLEQERLSPDYIHDRLQAWIASHR